MTTVTWTQLHFVRIFEEVCNGELSVTDNDTNLVAVLENYWPLSGPVGTLQEIVRGKTIAVVRWTVGAKEQYLVATVVWD